MLHIGVVNYQNRPKHAKTHSASYHENFKILYS